MIAIVDYGLGNIRAFGNIYNRLNIPFVYASTVESLKGASGIILPGVGSFDYAMHKLNESGLRETLDDLVLNEKVPIIGICVGMQMMAMKSDEGNSEGLAWLKTAVRKFETKENYPLPHMGWNQLSLLENPIFKDLEEKPEFYFLHSYHFDSDYEHVIASAEYSNSIGCVVNKDNIFGIQCHPEKSHKAGITVLKNFAEVANAQV
ncbi:imidazole glycerol phosphate synthase, glutamine amidotransferase subunit [Vibrio kanaloae]|uniref:imidazole glycerol phosphate synthase subunit HisH n=1 Tax=Vibrio kanaloae TaxID=170673 RepID=UPI000C82BA5A|nr:imidazole glycerol phosphate synthase subunit HisH [Vibrio kanaloae]KAB0460972.1 imidazole glycerol phosphate synthase subunit HisH [Vibrio kanaloae]PMM08647.1 imidazole glycerol phosphate synthase, glutamine amidotransferase subunit [Vibrio kanaloae]